VTCFGRKLKRSNLEILNKPLEESHEVFCFSDIPRNGFFEEIFRESCTTTQPKHCRG
jgi:hypothetical protein